tara:strand:+ start:16144 stop:16830 length:687 start_codon:yes stop_codon:yes gene_type:complete
VQLGFTLVEVLVVVAIIGVLVAIALPAISNSRQAARNAQCKNNLKQLGVSLQNHMTQRGQLPEDGFNSWGFGTFILPQLDQLALFDKLRPYEVARSGAFPVSLDGVGAKLDVWRCPIGPKGTAGGKYGRSTYKGNSPLFVGDFTFSDVLDGESMTVVAGEVLSDHAWAKPGTAGLSDPPNSGAFSSNHTGGANFVLCDGAVRFINESVDSATFQALGTPNGSDLVGDY